MAEVFIAGPLFNMGLFLGKWVWKRYKAKAVHKEHDQETKLFVKAVEKLAEFAKDKASAIQQFNRQFGLHSDSLGFHSYEYWLTIDILSNDILNAHDEAQKLLNDGKPNAQAKRERIEAIHTRLTQGLILHLGVVMLEVISRCRILKIKN